jgi:hypothetical protein
MNDQYRQPGRAGQAPIGDNGGVPFVVRAQGIVTERLSFAKQSTESIRRSKEPSAKRRYRARPLAGREAPARSVGRSPTGLVQSDWIFARWKNGAIGLCARSRAYPAGALIITYYGLGGISSTASSNSCRPEF